MKIWHVWLLQAVFLALVCYLVVTDLLPWFFGVLRANGVKGL